ncbi:hypothetical protein ARZXY2_2534 [Arthrobacter sp. ZXY-2]|nr:hypothetical protein ARZXY2_2534 [Arthrobacter sp. ZXY-2]
MSTERYELAEEIAGYRLGEGYYAVDIGSSDALAIADDILAAGYRKPRTVTTTEELDTLPDGVIIMDGRGSCREGLRTMGGGNVWRAMGPAKVLRSKEIALPATVLHEGSHA